MMLRQRETQKDSWNALDIAELVVNSLFALEVLAKFAAFTVYETLSSWANQLDLVVCVSTYMGMLAYTQLSVLQGLRILRAILPLRNISHFQVGIYYSNIIIFPVCLWGFPCWFAWQLTEHFVLYCSFLCICLILGRLELVPKWLHSTGLKYS